MEPVGKFRVGMALAVLWLAAALPLSDPLALAARAVGAERVLWWAVLAFAAVVPFLWTWILRRPPLRLGLLLPIAALCIAAGLYMTGSRNLDQLAYLPGLWLLISFAVAYFVAERARLRLAMEDSCGISVQLRRHLLLEQKSGFPAAAIAVRKAREMFDGRAETSHATEETRLKIERASCILAFCSAAIVYQRAVPDFCSSPVYAALRDRLMQAVPGAPRDRDTVPSPEADAYERLAERAISAAEDRGPEDALFDLARELQDGLARAPFAVHRVPIRRASIQAILQSLRRSLWDPLEAG